MTRIVWCAGPTGFTSTSASSSLLFFPHDSVRFGSRAPAHCPLSQHDTTRHDATRHAIHTSRSPLICAAHETSRCLSLLASASYTYILRATSGRPACLPASSAALVCCSRLLPLPPRRHLLARSGTSGQHLINLKRPIREPTRATTRHEATRRPPPARTPTGRPECRDSKHPFCTHVHITAQRNGTEPAGRAPLRSEENVHITILVEPHAHSVPDLTSGFERQRRAIPAAKAHANTTVLYRIDPQRK